LFFELVSSSKDQVIYRLKTEDPSKYIDFIYRFDSLSPYLINVDVQTQNFADLIRENGGELGFDFQLTALSKEKNLENEKNTSTIYFKYKEEDHDYISERDYEKKDLIAKTTWVAFKEQFFSSAIISNEGFSKTNAFIETVADASSPNSIKQMKTRVSLPFTEGAVASASHFQLYMGPNHYKTLTSLNNGMDQIIDLGWGIFGWVNEFLVIRYLIFSTVLTGVMEL
jgi:YidC/Oxa1 family membrane protein insertase